MEDQIRWAKAINELTPLIAVLLFLGALLVIVIVLWRGVPKLGIVGLGTEIKAELLGIKTGVERGIVMGERMEDLVVRLEGRILAQVDRQAADLSVTRQELSDLKVRFARLEGELSAQSAPVSSRAGPASQRALPKGIPGK